VVETFYQRAAQIWFTQSVHSNFCGFACTQTTATMRLQREKPIILKCSCLTLCLRFASKIIFNWLWHWGQICSVSLGRTVESEDLECLRRRMDGKIKNSPSQGRFNIQVLIAIIHHNDIHVIVTCLFTNSGHLIDEVLSPGYLVLHS